MPAPKIPAPRIYVSKPLRPKGPRRTYDILWSVARTRRLLQKNCNITKARIGRTTSIVTAAMMEDIVRNIITSTITFNRPDNSSPRKKFTVKSRHLQAALASDINKFKGVYDASKAHFVDSGFLQTAKTAKDSRLSLKKRITEHKNVLKHERAGLQAQLEKLKDQSTEKKNKKTKEVESDTEIEEEAAAVEEQEEDTSTTKQKKKGASKKEEEKKEKSSKKATPNTATNKKQSRKKIGGSAPRKSSANKSTSTKKK